MALPRTGDLDRTRVRCGLRPAHAEDDPLGEAEPDPVVVLDVRVAAQVDQGSLARVAVALRVEVQAVTLPGSDVAFRAELRPGCAPA